MKPAKIVEMQHEGRFQPLTVGQLKVLLANVDDDTLVLGDMYSPGFSNTILVGFGALTTPLSTQLYGDSHHYDFYDNEADAREYSCDKKIFPAIVLGWK